MRCEVTPKMCGRKVWKHKVGVIRYDGRRCRRETLILILLIIFNVVQQQKMVAFVTE